MPSGTRIATTAVLLLCGVCLGVTSQQSQRRHAESVKADGNEARVNVDLFVMSQCPDAFYCEHTLQPVLKQLQKHVLLTMHYIGERSDDGDWACKHGPQECDGNLQQLCVQEHTKTHNRYDWLFRFILCSNKAGRDKIGLYSTALKCLKEAGIPVSFSTRMLDCMYGPSHQQVLEADLALTTSIGIQTSCTIQVEGVTACVRDGGEWVVDKCPAGGSADQLLAAICNAYAGKNKGRQPPACRQLQLPKSL